MTRLSIFVTFGILALVAIGCGKKTVSSHLPKGSVVLQGTVRLSGGDHPSNTLPSISGAKFSGGTFTATNYTVVARSSFYGVRIIVPPHIRVRFIGVYFTHCVIVGATVADMATIASDSVFSDSTFEPFPNPPTKAKG